MPYPMRLNICETSWYPVSSQNRPFVNNKIVENRAREAAESLNQSLSVQMSRLEQQIIVSSAAMESHQHERLTVLFCGVDIVGNS